MTTMKMADDGGYRNAEGDAHAARHAVAHAKKTHRGRAPCSLANENIHLTGVTH